MSDLGNHDASGNCSGRTRRVYTVGDLTIDTALQRVARGGAEIALPRLSYELLLALVEGAPAVVSNDDLLARVWPGLVVADKTINQRVKLLRDALGDDAHAPRYVVGLRGRGYRIAAAVASHPWREGPSVQPGGVPAQAGLSTRSAVEGPEVLPSLPQPSSTNEAASSSVEPTEAAQPGDSAVPAPRPARFRVRGTVVALVILLAASGTATWVWLRDSAAIAEAPSRLPPESSPFSIAVLRFENQSGNPDNDYFAVGLSSEMTRLLARVHGLRVADAGAAIAPGGPAGGAAPAAPELARRLGVRWLLRGAVRESGARIRVVVELLRAEDAVQRWAEVYDRRKGDVFLLQDEIAAAVVNELRPRLEGELPQAQRTDPDAYALYLRAHYLTTRTSPAGLVAAIRLYRQALEIAPDYPAAWEGMARAYQQQAGLRLLPAGEAFELARAASTRAIAVDPRYGLAHARLGAIALLHDGDLATAARHMQHGYDLDPGHQLTNGNLAVLLRSMGRLEGALAFSERADRMDPLNPRGMYSSAYLHMVAGDFVLASARIDQVLELSPDFAGAHYLRAVLLVLEGRPEAALAEAAREKLPDKRLLATVLAAHALGRREDADAALRQLEAMRARGGVTAYVLACAYAWRGQHDRAFAWLDRAAARDVREYDVDFAQLIVDPLLRSLHADPRWLALLRRIGRDPDTLARIEVRAPRPQ